MSIQSGLNQIAALGVAGFTQTPTYAAMKEEKIKQTQIKGLESKLAEYDDELEKINPKMGEGNSAKESLEAGKASLQKQLLKLDPSASRLNMYYEEQAVRRAEANDQAQGKKANRQAQKQSILTDVNKWGEINGK